MTKYTHEYEWLARVVGADSIPSMVTAMRLTEHFGSVAKVFKATKPQLLEVRGVDMTLALRIEAVRGLARTGFLPARKQLKAQQSCRL